MWIKKLYATFGKLNNETLTLSSGLNVIYGKNESGKSTWTSFIRAMFYGISTREKKKDGFIPDKEKFLPWSGEAMYGKLELENSSGAITVERTSAKAGVLSKVTAKFDDSGLDAPVGDALVGVSPSVYERTAFIRQSGIGVSKDDETERRILSIVSSGDETVSAGEVINRLKKRLRLLDGASKNAEIPKLSAEYDALLRKISESSEKLSEIERITESLDACKAAEKKLQRDALIAKAEEEKNKRGYIEKVKADFSAAAEKLKETEGYPTRRELDMFLQKKNEMTAALLEKEQGEKLSALLREEISKYESKAANSPFAGLSEGAAKETSEKDISQISLGEKPRKKIAFAILAIVLTAVFAALGVLVSPIFFAFAVFSLAFSLGILFAKKKSGGICEEIAKKYGECSIDAINSALSEYIALLVSIGDASSKLSKNEALNKNKEITLSLYEEDMKKIALQFLQDDAENLALVEAKLTSLVSLREEAVLSEKEARAKVEALAATADVTSAAIKYTAEEIPSQSASEIEKEIKENAEQIKRFEIALATIKSSVSDFSPEKAQKELCAISEKLSELNDEYDALSLAIDTIDEAELELKTRFSPEIEKKTAEIFNYLTGGS